MTRSAPDAIEQVEATIEHNLEADPHFYDPAPIPDPRPIYMDVAPPVWARTYANLQQPPFREDSVDWQADHGRLKCPDPHCKVCHPEGG